MLFMDIIHGVDIETKLHTMNQNLTLIKQGSPALKKLYLISVPIGNLEDISYRGKKTLDTVSTIVVEEYKSGKKLLDQLKVDLKEKKILVLNEHIERPRKLSGSSPKKRNGNSGFEELFRELLLSPSAALISDAGTPVLADPGFRLLKEICHHGITLTHISGASSLVSGLLLSGFSLERFYYVGFLPQNHTARSKELKKLVSVKELLAIMETPYRLNPLLLSLKKIFPNQTPIAITFSLTTSDEYVFRGSLQEAVTRYTDRSGAEKNRLPFVLFLNNRR